MTKLSIFKDNFENPSIELVIRFKCVFSFWFVGMIERMANSMATTKVMENDDWFKTQQFESMILTNTKAPLKDKLLKQTMEFLHFNTMVKSYTTHFVTYNINKNK